MGKEISELICLIEIIVLIASKKIIGIITVEINNWYNRSDLK